jgi:hypothetical protein
LIDRESAPARVRVAPAERPRHDIVAARSRERAMIGLEAIDALERAHAPQSGQPTLGRAFELLLARRRAGARDRETTLRLLFLAWYLDEEPPFLTGAEAGHETRFVFCDLVDAVVESDTDDAESLYAVGQLVSLSPWHLADEQAAVELGRSCLARAAALRPDGFRPEHFDGRGEYGRYFAHMIRAGAFR